LGNACQVEAPLGSNFFKRQITPVAERQVRGVQ
jgi:hypothetical protein